MPVYQYEGKHYDLPSGLSNEEAIAKIEGFLGKSPKVDNSADETARLAARYKAPETPKPEAPSGFMQGLTDPLYGSAQLVAKGMEAVGFFPKEAKAFSERVVPQREQQYEAQRKAAGETGFDLSRLAGNIINPANLIPVPVANPLARSVATGAVMGAMQPVSQPEDFASTKALQVGTGAVLGPVAEGTVNALGKVVGLVKNLTPSGRQEAMVKYVNELAGPERDAVIKALQDAKELVSGSRPTVAEALANVPSAAELVAAQAKLAKESGVAGKFAERTAEQQAARVRALQGIAGTEAERAAIASERNAVTGGMRETALDQANVAGPVFTKLEKEIADKFNSVAAAEQTAGMTGMAAATQQATAQAGKPGWLTAGDLAAEAAQRSGAYKGLASNLRKEAQLKEFQLGSLEQNGFFPLRASDITASIDSAIKGTISDQSKLVLQGVKDKILSKADDNGIINSRDLYENVRKTLNQDIATYLGQSEKYASGGIPEQAAKAAGNVKNFIDSALNKSSDGLWSKYLNEYSTYSNKLNRMEIGDYLANKLQTGLDKERAGVFATAVENAANTIKRSTGIPRYEKLSQVLTDKEVGTVNSVLADLMRKSKADELASKVSKLESGLPNVASETPDVMLRAVTIAKSLMRHLQQGNQKEFNNKMAEMMLDPAAFAQFMSVGIPKGRIGELTSSMMKYMDEPTKAAFIQSFTVPAVSQELGK
jgi:hypothetical protein